MSERRGDAPGYSMIAGFHAGMILAQPIPAGSIWLAAYPVVITSKQYLRACGNGPG